MHLGLVEVEDIGSTGFQPFLKRRHESLCLCQMSVQFGFKGVVVDKIDAGLLGFE